MKPSSRIEALSWPIARIGEGLEELARRAGLAPVAGETLVVADSVDVRDTSELGRWIEWASRSLSLEAQSVATPVPEFETLLRAAGPALLTLKGGKPAFLLLLKSRWGQVQLIGPDLKIHRWAVADLRDAVCAPLEAPFLGTVNHVLDTAKVPEQRRRQARRAMLQDHLIKQDIGGCWLLRASPSSNFWRQMLHVHLPHKLVLMLAVFAVLYVLEVIGWSLMGQATLNGRMDMAFMGAWVLLLMSLILLHLLGNWLDATFALLASRLLKTRLLVGALRADMDQVRQQGAGQLLSRVMESQALESLAVNGGLGVLVAILELGFAALILLSGAGGYFHLALLAVWVALTLGLSWNYFQRMRHWIGMRLDMTHELIERMVGHRTILAQEPPQRRNEVEDQAMKDYLLASKAMDLSVVPAAGVMPRGWLLVGLLGLAPAFMAGSASAASLGIALGGMLLANRAMSGISGGMAALARAVLAWKRVTSLFHAATVSAVNEPFLSRDQLHPAAGKSRYKVIDASAVKFSYSEQAAPVLRGANLSIYQGEQILLEGASGGGKSTLASLLVGLRTPQSGLLLLNGLDRHTLGESWHQLVTEAPQFHENHILSGTLAFNLLMGRQWPADPEMLVEAQELCEELGLGELLARMPSGLMQMVGETGWQLSHGERSRVFLARALLQKSRLILLDESFGALDPQTLEKCLDCVLARAPTLVVIAHP
jgi:ATP-binding cassette subfamily B protein